MGTQVIIQKVSDISGEPVEDASQLTQLTIEYPGFSAPVTLEVLPEEVEPVLPDQEDLVLVTYVFPGAPQGQKYLLTETQLEELFGDRPVATVLQEVATSQQEEQERQEREQEQRSRRGRRRQQGTQRRERVNWAGPDRAGEPHPGRVSPAEQAYVREHLQEVNTRLATQGHRQIDPTDLEMQRRYGLTPPSPAEEPV